MLDCCLDYGTSEPRKGGAGDLLTLRCFEKGFASFSISSSSSSLSTLSTRCFSLIFYSEFSDFMSSCPKKIFFFGAFLSDISPLLGET